MAVKTALSTLMLLLSACMTITPPAKIALLAPFEGRYREIGYNALYAIRLATSPTNMELLAVDDGGTPDSAADRARALAGDPQVQAALVLGYASTDPAVLAAFGDVPVVVVGGWGAQPVAENVFILSAPALEDLVTIAPRIEITDAARLEAPFTGGAILALEQFSRLRPSPEDITIVSSASLPGADFTGMYTASDPFAPDPGLLATLSYDAASLMVEAVRQHNSRSGVQQALQTTLYEGINGTIRFESGYWADAPIHYFQYDIDGDLLPVEGIVEQR